MPEPLLDPVPEPVLPPDPLLEPEPELLGGGAEVVVGVRPLTLLCGDGTTGFGVGGGGETEVVTGAGVVVGGGGEVLGDELGLRLETLGVGITCGIACREDTLSLTVCFLGPITSARTSPTESAPTIKIEPTVSSTVLCKYQRLRSRFITTDVGIFIEGLKPVYICF